MYLCRHALTPSRDGNLNHADWSPILIHEPVVVATGTRPRGPLPLQFLFVRVAFALQEKVRMA